jgi:hypothetical protein
MTKAPAQEQTPSLDDRLRDARAASLRHAWQEAFDGFAAADADTPLNGADLETFAEAAFFTANIDERERALERAVKVYTAEGNRTRAAGVALGVSIDLLFQAGRRSHRRGSSVPPGSSRASPKDMRTGTSRSHAASRQAMAVASTRP